MLNKEEILALNKKAEEYNKKRQTELTKKEIARENFSKSQALMKQTHGIEVSEENFGEVYEKIKEDAVKSVERLKQQITDIDSGAYKAKVEVPNTVHKAVAETTEPNPAVEPKQETAPTATVAPAQTAPTAPTGQTPVETSQAPVQASQPVQAQQSVQTQQQAVAPQQAPQQPNIFANVGAQPPVTQAQQAPQATQQPNIFANVGAQTQPQQQTQQPNIFAGVQQQTQAPQPQQQEQPTQQQQPNIFGGVQAQKQQPPVDMQSLINTEQKLPESNVPESAQKAIDEAFVNIAGNSGIFQE